jgi:catechol 2,3-dioxygenase-like lactoylglutathione lyase family enzyme
VTKRSAAFIKRDQAAISGFANVATRFLYTDFRVVITLLIDDVDGVYKLLKARGIATESNPELSEQFNVYQFFVRDPNGYLVEIQRFIEPLA